MDLDVLWTNILSQIKIELSSLSYDTWFSETKLDKIDNNKAFIIVSMPIQKKHLSENYSDLIKKQFREIEAVKEMFFNKGHELGTSDNLLSYIWYVQVSAQLGYSFSEIHTTGYALIALQEMNLA